MKIGFIIESGADGAEAKVLPLLAKRIDPSVEIRSPLVFNHDKPDMISSCGLDASMLLDECDRVIIVCDLGSDRHSCGWQQALANDIIAIRHSLKENDVDIDRVRLLIIREEIETWFVADHRAVAAFLSTRTRACTLRRVRDPETILNPKKQLARMFNGRKKRYWDIEDAVQIAKEMTDMECLNHICSFVRFKRLISETDFVCSRISNPSSEVESLPVRQIRT